MHKFLNIEIIGISLTKTEFIDLCGVVVGLFTLVLAFLIQRAFARSHMKTKQIDHVYDMLNKLNTSSFQTWFATYDQSNGGIGSGGLALQYNIFEIASFDVFDSNNEYKEYYNEPVCFDRNSNQLFDIKPLITHPLTPSKIADELLNFYNTNCDYLSVQSPQKEITTFVQISDGHMEKREVLENNTKSNVILGDAFAFRSWENFIYCAKRLELEINKWFSNNGIKGRNTRADFRTPM